MIILFGLKSCDTCRRARRWLDQQGLQHRFHDLRADGLNADMLDRWIDAAGWQALLNRRGTTWRRLSAETSQPLSPETARALMLEHPTLIKRPVIDAGRRILLGFDANVRSVLQGTQEPAL